ncbi:GRAM domain-containing protein 2A isoform X5 [Takifugu rubripes]|uniref:GRAM domain-containing protein 2A isoform X5 n=1 Tax=Takifugu rubripes TaxID=31033 RepID=UPI00114535E8|nr:GRAM domain-containing protein 2A-like isoform X5 [Takifugu rubripes]
MCVLQQPAPGPGCARVCVCVRSQRAEPGAELAPVGGEGGGGGRSRRGQRRRGGGGEPVHQGAAHDSALSLCTDRQQVQLPVPQTVPVCPQGRAPHERDILLQGRLYISRNWLCFYANLFGKDIKVAIPVVSVRLVKKHKTAGLVPNGLAITTDTGQKYVFVSLLSRDSVYDILRRICTHLQVNGKSLSLKQFMEEPTLSLDEFPASDELVDEFPSVLKWRSKPAVVSMSASLPDLLGNSSSNLSSADKPVKPEQLLEERDLQTDRGLLSEPVAELGQMEYQLLRFFTLLIILLILSSCYLAFRVCSLEQQLSFLNPNLPLRER